ncbi:ATP-dependent DNA helicase UvrD2 [Actinomadura sp. HBU206391]|uniref:ATP-dependent DNA helicase UvrD2 n=1 Tax=Actinomadura sp. HBU206391 TaxID=2731692 RepID=UPI00164FF692|nr:ATP-dependent DNA helicase UvrD2 [Actinomadura sp. HBU206391]MBC6462405.1 UvrD-helicase domain-containing protein [Actinomadura sp. HBU206391]
MEPEEVLAGLDPEQRAVAEAVRGPVCVLAGAGTGKTRAITHRIAYATLTGIVTPQRVLAVTFTTRAAGELRGRLRQLGAPGVQARTFHAAALRQLTYFWPKVIGGEPPKIIESKLGLIADAARACRLSFGRTELRDVAGEVEWAKVTQTRPEDYPAAAAKAGRKPPVDAVDVARIFVMYESLRRERNLLDFEGMLELTAAVLTEHREIANQVREQYRYFVVDEYQDVNPLQKLLLDTWLGDRDDLCVVGDPSQTIYSFTGATPSYLLGFTRDHPNAQVVRLVRDYRSTPQVVRLANDVLARRGTGSRADADGSRPALELIAQRDDGPEPTFTEYDDEVAEAEDVARKVTKLIENGVPAREVAVLFRINAQSQIYEQAFADAGLPYVLRGAERFFERPAVREAVVRLRGATRSGGDADNDGTGLIATVRHVLSGIGFNDKAPEGTGAAREKWESLAALAQLAEDMAVADASAGLVEFVAELEERAAAQHAPPLEGVTLASLHAAKGLEWDALFLVGLTDGTLPIIYAETPDQIEEERRLLYVGVTRAREHLALSWSLARAPGGRKVRRCSRFLDGIAPQTSTSTPARMTRTDRPRSAKGPQPCRVCARPLTAALERKLGRCEGCPADLDEALFAGLKTWRVATAKEQKVPAYVVFTDATLQAIAERRPESEAELAVISGVGRAKLDRYGASVLALCRGETPATTPDLLD